MEENGGEWRRLDGNGGECRRRDDVENLRSDFQCCVLALGLPVTQCERKDWPGDGGALTKQWGMCLKGRRQRQQWAPLGDMGVRAQWPVAWRWFWQGGTSQTRMCGRG